MSRIGYLAASLLTAAAVPAPLPADAATCDELAKLALPDTTITTADIVSAGAFKPTTGGAAAQAIYARRPEFCRVAASLRPTSDSDIKIEVWLPASGGRASSRPSATARR